MTPEMLTRLQCDSELWINEVLGCDSMEPYQSEICKDIALYDRIAISACHAVGKTWLMARIALWFINCFPYSKVITTAPTNRQVEMLLWGEIGEAYQKSAYPLGGHLTNKKLDIAPGWFAIGFSPEKKAGSESEEQQGSEFQGFHARYILVIFDEAVGIEPDIWKQVEGLLTSGEIVKFICIGNPTNPNCDFAECFDKPTWRKIYLSCFDSPNLIANDITDYEKLEAEIDILRALPEDERLERLASYKKPVVHLLSCQWVMEKGLEWGLDSPLFKSKVLGQFPDSSSDSIVQLEHVKTAQARKHCYDLGWNDTKKVGRKDLRVVGVDVARFGDDMSEFCEIYGSVQTRTETYAKRDTMDIAGNLVRFLLDEDDGRPTNVPIDCTGIGSGVFDRMVELQKTGDDFGNKIPKNFKFIEIHFGASVKQVYTLRYGKKLNKRQQKDLDDDQKTYSNLKSKMFTMLDHELRDNLRLKDEEIYRKELPSIRYKFTSSGKMAVESKEEYKKRTGKKSPDKSDALAIANLGRKIRPSISALLNLTRK